LFHLSLPHISVHIGGGAALSCPTACKAERAHYRFRRNPAKCCRFAAKYVPEQTDGTKRLNPNEEANPCGSPLLGMTGFDFSQQQRQKTTPRQARYQPIRDTAQQTLHRRDGLAAAQYSNAIRFRLLRFGMHQSASPKVHR
jgi:hypothetical protein